MTQNQKRLQELLEQKTRHRRRMREIAESRRDLTPELRSELQVLENVQLDLERNLRAARAAVEAETADTAATEPPPPRAS